MTAYEELETGFFRSSFLHVLVEQHPEQWCKGTLFEQLVGALVSGDRDLRHRPQRRRDQLSQESGPIRTSCGYNWAMVAVEFERVEALELLGMTLAHLSDAEMRGEMSSRVPLLMTIRDKLALALREES